MAAYALNDAHYGDANKLQLITADNHKEMFRPHTLINFTTKPDPEAAYFKKCALRRIVVVSGREQ